MTAPSGWYDAGVPNRQRWWDGVQWTAYERDTPLPGHAAEQASVPVPVPQASVPGTHAPVPHAAARQDPTPSSAPASPQRIPAGWYAVPGSDEVRWRDDQHWTPYRIANGKPGANWYATEPPLIGYVFGGLFMLLGMLQGIVAIISGNATNAVLMLLLGVFWLSTGIGGSMVRGKPTPVTAAVAPPSAQPLPGQAEGPGAGWYPVSARVSRWWSGARWASYVHESNRVRPTYGGPKLYRTMQIMAWVMIGVGVLALAAGVILLVVNVGLPSFLGMFLLIAGLVLALVGAIMFPIIFMRKPALLLPESAPTPR